MHRNSFTVTCSVPLCCISTGVTLILKKNVWFWRESKKFPWNCFVILLLRQVEVSDFSPFSCVLTCGARLRYSTMQRESEDGIAQVWAQLLRPLKSLRRINSTQREKKKSEFEQISRWKCPAEKSIVGFFPKF